MEANIMKATGWNYPLRLSLQLLSLLLLQSPCHSRELRVKRQVSNAGGDIVNIPDIAQGTPPPTPSPFTPETVPPTTTAGDGGFFFGPNGGFNFDDLFNFGNGGAGGGGFPNRGRGGFPGGGFPGGDSNPGGGGFGGFPGLPTPRPRPPIGGGFPPMFPIGGGFPNNGGGAGFPPNNGGGGGGFPPNNGGTGGFPPNNGGGGGGFPPNNGGGGGFPTNGGNNPFPNIGFGNNSSPTFPGNNPNFPSIPPFNTGPGSGNPFTNFPQFTTRPPPTFPTLNPPTTATPENQCSPPLFTPLEDQVSNATIPPNIQAVITQQLTASPQLSAYLDFAANINDGGVPLPSGNIESNAVSCPVMRQRATVFQRNGGNCWILQDKHPPAFYVTCKCNECLVPTGFRQSPGSACEPFMQPTTVFALCENGVNFQAQITRERIALPVTCRCRHAALSLTQRPPGTVASPVVTTPATPSTTPTANNGSGGDVVIITS